MGTGEEPSRTGDLISHVLPLEICGCLWGRGAFSDSTQHTWLYVGNSLFTFCALGVDVSCLGKWFPRLASIAANWLHGQCWSNGRARCTSCENDNSLASMYWKLLFQILCLRGGSQVISGAAAGLLHADKVTA